MFLCYLIGWFFSLFPDLRPPQVEFLIFFQSGILQFYAHLIFLHLFYFFRLAAAASRIFVKLFFCRLSSIIFFTFPFVFRLAAAASRFCVLILTKNLLFLFQFVSSIFFPPFCVLRRNCHKSAFGRLAAAASRKFEKLEKSRSLVVTMWRTAAWAAEAPSLPRACVLQAVLVRIVAEILFGNAPLENRETTVLEADHRPVH